MDTTRINPHSAIGVYATRLKKIEAYLLEKFNFSIDEAIDADPQQMNQAEAAAYLGCDRMTIRNYRLKNILPAHVGKNGRYYFLRSEIDAVFTKKPNKL